MIIEFYVSKPHIFKVKIEKQAVWPNVFVIVYLLVVQYLSKITSPNNHNPCSYPSDNGWYGRSCLTDSKS